MSAKVEQAHLDIAEKLLGGVVLLGIYSDKHDRIAQAIAYAEQRGYERCTRDVVALWNRTPSYRADEFGFALEDDKHVGAADAVFDAKKEGE